MPRLVCIVFADPVILLHFIRVVARAGSLYAGPQAIVLCPDPASLRFVREAGHMSMRTACAALKGESLDALVEHIAERLADGLSDNWSQVRFECYTIICVQGLEASSPRVVLGTGVLRQSHLKRKRSDCFPKDNRWLETCELCLPQGIQNFMSQSCRRKTRAMVRFTADLQNNLVQGQLDKSILIVSLFL